MATELDFNTIKMELKDYLKGQPQFTEYNFEGSNLNILLDILAYNTHYNAMYANMIVNEQFLDSAIKRANVVSLAKHLGYVPRSSRAASVNINMVAPANGANQLTLNKWTKFTGKKDGENIPFVLMEPATAFSSNGIFAFNNLQLKQGITSAWEFLVANPDEKFELPSADIDLSTLEVIVLDSGTSTPFTQFERGEYYKDYDSTSTIYFVEENANGYYDLYFSDGIIGRKIQPGNTIEVRYLVTSGDEGNDIATFSASVAYQSISLSDSRFPSSGGAVRENMQSIKFNAPRFYSSQGRAITSEDYTSILLSEIADIESIIVWGGEIEIPPRYGRVFISIKPVNNTRISNSLMARINRVLSGRGVISIVSEVVEPDYIFVGLQVNSVYDARRVTQVRTVQENILAAIQDFFRDNLQKFDKDFRFSKFVSAIDNSNNAIESSLVSMTIQKRVVPTGIVETILNNKIVPGTLYSSRFFRKIRGLAQLGAIKDNGDGLLYFASPNNADIEIGTVNYQNGHIRFALNNTQLLDSDSPDLPTHSPSSIYFMDDFAGFHPAYTDTLLRLTAEVDQEGMNLKTLKNQIIVLDNTVNNIATQEREGLRIIVQESTLA
jgi:hypothetical protein